MGWLLGDERLAWTTADRRVTRRPRELPSIYHVMSPFELQRTLDELWPAWARSSKLRTVVTLYDLIPMVFPDHYLRDPVLRGRYETRAKLVTRADRVLAISQTTAQDAVERLEIPEERITVVNAGATDKFAGMYASTAAAWDALRGRLRSVRPGFILYVAGFEFRKNLARTVAGYGLLSPELRRKHQLVIACRMLPAEAEFVQEWAREAGIEPGQLVITGYVTDEELGALYHSCELFLFSSLYEGSGLPILEAMSCDAPVVASGTSTAPELLGDLEATFDPYDPGAIAACLADVLESQATLDVLRERSRRRVTAYTWGEVARRSLEAYENVIDDNRAGRRRRRQRARIALVTPWPPERSGVADYSLRLARELGAKVDVDVVVAESLDHYAPPLEQGVRLVEARHFRAAERLRQTDRILYCMGNSSFHRHVYELLRLRPGAVLAHDVRLTGFYGWFAGVENPTDPAGRLQERIRVLYGSRLPPAAISNGPPDWQQQATLGIYMTQEIQEYAEQIFVHSRYARDVLELDRGVLAREVPVSVLPFGMPAADAGQRSSRRSSDVVTIVTVGVVSEVKGLATLIESMAMLALENVRARLVIAGPGEPQELQRWRDFAAETAPGVDIEISGHLATEEYASLLQRADIAVQLRTLSNGEASAAVADCMAAGLPTVVTDVGWAAELPDDAVARVPLGASPALLAGVLETLVGSGGEGQRLGERARAHAQAASFEHVADGYLHALELV